MHSPVPLAVTKVLAEKASDRAAWIRFNFRGVEGSEGSHDDGRGEVDDVLAVMSALRRAVPAGTPLSLCGHSFGSWAGLQATLRDGAVDRLLLIAPSVRFSKEVRGAGSVRPVPRSTVFIGDRDELCDVDEARELADELGADLRVFEGFDHHFLKSRRAMAEAALPVIVPEVVSP
jgi:alpha/beta superfamily hydrolase